MPYQPPGSAAPAPAPYGSSSNNNNNNTSSYSANPSPSYGYGSAPAPANNSYSSNPSGSGGGGGYATPGYSNAPAPAYGSGSGSGGGGYSSSPAPAYGQSTGGGYNSSPAPATTTYDRKPDFSQALNVPPPAQTSAPSYGQSQPSYGGGGGYGAAPSAPPAATPYSGSAPAPSYGGQANTTTSSYGGGGGGQASYGASQSTATRTPSDYAHAGSSSVFSPGPTNGLVSEGNPTQCHKVDYEIKGHEMQLVEIELDPQETVIAEAGALMFLDEGIVFETKFGDGSEPKQTFWKKLMSAGGRLLTGESLF
ncbi:MAG: hypothetical protein SGBAC_003452, partial [Bacillariaceae sp.]